MNCAEQHPCTSSANPVHSYSPAFGRAGLLAAFWLAVASLAAFAVVQGFALGAAPGWVTYWGVVTALLALVPRFPVAGPSCFVLLAYGMSSNARELDILLAMRLLDGAAILALAGSLLASNQWRPRLPNAGKFTAVMAVLLFVWIAVSLTVAVMDGLPIGTFLRHHPTGFFQCAVMLVVSASAIRDRRDCIVLSTVFVATIIGRAMVQGVSGMYLESYVATLLLLSAPIAILGAIAAQRWPLRWSLGAGAAVMVFLLAMTQNRAAAVAAFATLVVLIWQRRRVAMGKYLAGALVASSVVLVLAPTPYIDRFRALTSHDQVGETAELDRSTVQARLNLWSIAWEMALQNPVLGVGPGNYPASVNIYRTGVDSIATHSSYLQMLAETGFPGLFLYIGFFLATIFMLSRAPRIGGVSWQRGAAQMLQLSLTAYLAGGAFNSRHDLVLAYVLAGWAFAIHGLERSASVKVLKGDLLQSRAM